MIWVKRDVYSADTKPPPKQLNGGVLMPGPSSNSILRINISIPGAQPCEVHRSPMFACATDMTRSALACKSCQGNRRVWHYQQQGL